MKKLITISLITAVSLSATSINLTGKKIWEDGTSIGRSHGGNKADIDSYTDGVGVIIKNFGNNKDIDMKEFNQAVLKYGEEAKKRNLSVEGVAPQFSQKFFEKRVKTTSEDIPVPNIDDISLLENQDTSEITLPKLDLGYEYVINSISPKINLTLSGEKISIKPKKNLSGEADLEISVKDKVRNKVSEPIEVSVSINPSDFKNALVNICKIPESDYIAKWDKDSGIYSGYLNCNNKPLKDSELDSFEMLKEVKGSLILAGTDITNVYGLRNLEKIDGSTLYIGWNFNLKSLDGLKDGLVVNDLSMGATGIKDLSKLEKITVTGTLTANNSIAPWSSYNTIFTTKISKDNPLCKENRILYHYGVSNGQSTWQSISDSYEAKASVCDIPTLKEGISIPIHGQDSYTKAGYESWISPMKIKVEPGKTYTLSIDAQSGIDGIYNPNNSQYAGFACYDIDKQFIDVRLIYKYPGAKDTRLAKDLNNGDKEVLVYDASGWSNKSLRYTRKFVWYGYKDSRGHLYPDYTYTRYASNDDLWPINGITNNNNGTWTIKLNRPWDKGFIAKDTAIRNSSATGTYNYSLIHGESISKIKKRYNGSIINSQNGISSAKTRPGTAYISPIILINHYDAISHNQDNKITYSNLRMKEN